LLELEEDEERISNKLYLYSNIYSLDQTNISFIRLLKEVELVENKYRELLSWIAPELDEVSEDDAMKWIKDSELSYYEKDIKEFYRLKKHRLNKNDAELVSKLARSRSAASQIYSELTVSDAEIPVLKFNDEEIKLTQTKYSEIMKNSDPKKDRDLRREATLKYYERYYKNKFTLSSIYQKIAEKVSENTKITKFDNTLDASLFGNDIPKSVYEKLLEVASSNKKIVEKNSKMYADYLKKEYGLDDLVTSDAQLELFSNNKRYEIDDAISIIDKVAKNVSPEYHSVFKQVVKPGYIDYIEGENKVKGAYSTGNTIYDPLILMNWTYDLGSVLTLAHEIGHSIHTILSNKNQKLPYQGYSIYLAEIASTLLEMLVIDDLIDNTKNTNEKMFLLNHKIDTQIATFFRQAQFADFEKEVLESVHDGKIYDHEQLSELFIDKAKKYGKTNTFKRINDDMKYVWTRISHFFGSPYYVYQYATCIAASFSLIDSVKKGKPESFIHIIKSGSVENPDIILKKNGINLSTNEAYKPLINSMNNTLKEIEKIYKKI
ncbi:MAG: hypothetical protein HRS57_01450, partial [Mycoplasmataceae bacterium]|nr:hypothetical protein [Mycoplasmataceae bacterium]